MIWIKIVDPKIQCIVGETTFGLAVSLGRIRRVSVLEGSQAGLLELRR